MKKTWAVFNDAICDFLFSLGLYSPITRFIGIRKAIQSDSLALRVRKSDESRGYLKYKGKTMASNC